MVEGLDGSPRQLLEIVLIRRQQGQQLLDKSGIFFPRDARLAVCFSGGRDVLVLDSLLGVGGLVGFTDFDEFEANGPEGAEFCFVRLRQVAQMAGQDFGRHCCCLLGALLLHKPSTVAARGRFMRPLLGPDLFTGVRIDEAWGLFSK
jgi:hypothetical protein